MVEGVRSLEVAAKIDLHLDRFRAFCVGLYGHERISTVGRRDVIDWQRRLAEKLAPATVNNHLASLSGFTTWVSAQEPGLFTTENPSTGISALPLPPLEPRSLAHQPGVTHTPCHAQPTGRRCTGHHRAPLRSYT